MKKTLLLVLALSSYCKAYSQKILTSWSQQNIENYTKEMYNQAQKLTATQLLAKTVDDKSWGEVFVTLNASANNYAKDDTYLKGLADQITNKKETKLQGTSRLVIWDRITSGDITFEGKGLVIDNDLFTVAGRANQLLQSLTDKNFGFVTIHSSDAELKAIREKWLGYLSGKAIAEHKTADQPNAKIPEISSLPAVEALIVSLQPNPVKDQLTKSCLKRLYNLDELPKERGSQASYCSPDTYTLAYLGMLFGDKTMVESKDAKWWKNFWTDNHDKLVWNPGNGIYEVKK